MQNNILRSKKLLVTISLIVILVIAGCTRAPSTIPAATPTLTPSALPTLTPVPNSATISSPTLRSPITSSATPASAPIPTPTPSSTTTYPVTYNPPKLSDAPSDIASDVMLGYNIINESQKYASKYVGNKLNCSSCHFSGGITQDGKNGGLSLVGVAAKYPTYRKGGVSDLVQRVNSCFAKSENGTPPSPDSDAMVAVITYLHWISKGIPIYEDVPWLGIKPLQSSHQPDAASGKTIFTSVCTACHGTEGQGTSIVIDGVSPPPLYGNDSYNDAAGMANPVDLAAFAYNNMPFKNPALTIDQALDVAAYVDTQPRPHYSAPSPSPTPKPALTPSP